MKEKKVYISVPIAHLDYEEQQTLAALVERLLVETGHEAANPFRNGLPKDAAEVEHMRRDMDMLRECDAIVMLPGWEQSEGCFREWCYALGLGLEVYYYRPKVIV